MWILFVLEVSSLAPILLGLWRLDSFGKVIGGKVKGYAKVYHGDYWSHDQPALLV